MERDNQLDFKITDEQYIVYKVRIVSVFGWKCFLACYARNYLQKDGFKLEFLFWNSCHGIQAWIPCVEKKAEKLTIAERPNFYLVFHAWNSSLNSDVSRPEYFHLLVHITHLSDETSAPHYRRLALQCYIIHCTILLSYLGHLPCRQSSIFRLRPLK